ncbi:TRAP transporter large permease [Pseudazoarcus pumilus]|uniref:TRAP transporter large permease protein n=1 Tax=Pseudazoarcus pumilus TaxID=2067960 RepID=A0A2I6S3D8_9RHOO|nr:TRAP transporter large permease subunit [Pseudazoarcus pumilus]AUN93755.1 C4-dicarboxylate ABC transporter permease [Pseudazoarcus pumilus]
MNEMIIIVLVLFGALLALLASGVWVAVTLIVVGFIAIAAFTPSPPDSLLAITVWDHSWNWALTALPLFVWMGEILTRSRLSQDMFSGLAPWLSWLPGRLLHVNIIGCSVMAAVAGSSAVTAATIGRMSLPELKKRGYSESMSLGTLAGAGTLGLLIPPSIMMIVYGIVTQQSIARLFIAGLIPGLVIISLFMGYVIIWSLINRDKMPPNDIRMSFMEKLWNSRRLIPVIVLIVLVIGSIYTGFATPTEAATIGVLGALGLAWVSRTLTLRSFLDGLMGAMRTSCMITFIIAGASFLAIGMAFTGIPAALAAWVEGLGLSTWMLLVMLTLIYIVLGCFLEGASMIVLTASIALPMIQAAGLDPIWFGIYLIIVVEMSQITPPVGFNLFVLQGMSGRDLMVIARSAFPFFMVMILGIVVLATWPGLVTFLPDLMMNR